MDYFTKWIEAKPVATITGNQIKKFVWDNIVCIFRLPGEIISDNGKQFRDNPFKDWCEKLCIRQHFASVKHPQTNGLVERANRSLGEGIKARLGARNKKWMEEISHVLWAHRTMIKSSNGDTPFSLTYGTEAVIPAEIGMPTLRTAEVDLVQNNEALEINLDLLEERREQATIREAKSKARMEKYYKSKVKNTSFKPGDLVYDNNDASRMKDTGKLGTKWKGPYEVTEALRKGAYKLRDRYGKQLPQT
ncbi:reverse transcriptase domain-containing protein [Tanacetum coccineum]